MKIISLERQPGSVVSLPPLLSLYPDSAIVRLSTPLFLPDFADSWEGALYVAVRISRLGKCIAPKFAGRYYDAFTLALRAIPVDIERGLAESHTTATALTSCFDYCVAPGEWIEGTVQSTLAISCGAGDIFLTPDEISVDSAIAAASRYMTLRTGDIIMPCRLAVTILLQPDRPVDASVGGRPVLHVKVK